MKELHTCILAQDTGFSWHRIWTIKQKCVGLLRPKQRSSALSLSLQGGHGPRQPSCTYTGSVWIAFLPQQPPLKHCDRWKGATPTQASLSRSGV